MGIVATIYNNSGKVANGGATRPRSGSIPPIPSFVGREALKLAEDNNVMLKNSETGGDTSGENRVGKLTIDSWERHTYATIYNICATPGAQSRD